MLFDLAKIPVLKTEYASGISYGRVFRSGRNEVLLIDPYHDTGGFDDSIGLFTNLKAQVLG